jgi:hypothetical protein
MDLAHAVRELQTRITAFNAANPTRIGLQINQQFNNGNLALNQVELDDARRRLDQTNLLEQKRKAGVATNAELREHFIEKIGEYQHLVDC